VTENPHIEESKPRIEGSVRIDEAVGAAAMAIICLISFANVIVRYATNISFAFTEEFSVFLLVVMTMAGTSLAFATDSHIRITFALSRFGPRGERFLEAFSLVATTLVFSLVVFYGALFAYDQWAFDETSAGLGYPTWIYSVWLPVLGCVVILRAVQSGLRKLRARP